VAEGALVIDDLVTPNLGPLQRQILEHLEQRPVNLDPDALIQRAITRTGLSDFGSEGFRVRLAAHVDAIDADTGNTNLNRLTLRNRIIRLLCSRLLLTDLLARYPEIRDIQIKKPIIVVGLPRSGTTHLVNLIAADTRRRALPYWESQEPFPLRGQGPDANGIDPRYARSLAEHDIVRQTAPHTAAMHDRHPSAIEEEVELLDIDFASYVLEWHARVPQWRDFYLSLDQDSHYGYLRTVLQALTFLRGPNHWVLKSPQHCEQLAALTKTFPDATVAFTHRDPAAVIGSAVTMLAYGDRMRRRSIEPRQLIDYWAERIERLLRALVADRDLIPAESSLDIARLDGNEPAIVAELYARNGTELPEATRTALRRHLADHPRGKQGQVRYDLRRHFGRSADEIRSRFEFYFRRFDVRPQR